MAETRLVPDLEKEVDLLLALGYRLDMIMPADDPREAIVSRDGQVLRLSSAQNPQSAIRNPKSRGRAGMEYRDLIPDRLGGRVIASHIRITEGGDVPDYAHYHKLRFQMIFCRSGWVRVVYEDQGEPFVMNAGDCVLQPPEIRHRVLESSAGAEVIEISSPAEHETWTDHDITLPTRNPKSDRSFGGQRFARHIAAEASWSSVNESCRIAETPIEDATNGDAQVRRITLKADGTVVRGGNWPFVFLYVLAGAVVTAGSQCLYRTDDHFVVTDGSSCILKAVEDLELVEVCLREI